MYRGRTQFEYGANSIAFEVLILNVMINSILCCAVQIGRKQKENWTGGYPRANKCWKKTVVGGEIVGKTKVGCADSVYQPEAKQVPSISSYCDNNFGRWGWWWPVVVHDWRTQDQVGPGETRVAGDGWSVGRTCAETGDRDQGHGKYLARFERLQHSLQIQPVFREPGKLVDCNKMTEV